MRAGDSSAARVSLQDTDGDMGAGTRGLGPRALL
jgi:hypothetical protein